LKLLKILPSSGVEGEQVEIVQPEHWQVWANGKFTTLFYRDTAIAEFTS